MTLNIEKTKIIFLYSSKRLKRISKIIMDKLSTQENIILQSYSDDMDKLIFRKIDLADELFIIDDALSNKEYSKIVEYARMHGKNIRFLSQTPLNNFRKRYYEVKGEIFEARL